MNLYKQNLGKMETNQFEIRLSTLAQIKPSIIYSLIYRLIFLVFLIAIFFSNTSYLGRAKTKEFYSAEMYHQQMHKGFIIFSKNYSSGVNARVLNVPSLVNDFYRENGYNPVWTVNQSISLNALNAIELLDKASLYGLNPETYHVKSLLSFKEKIQAAQTEKQLIRSRNAFELLLSDACLSFMINIHHGMVTFDSILSDQFVKSLPVYFTEIVSNSSMNNNILSLQPTSQEYIYLQKGLEKFLRTVQLSNEKYIISDFNEDSISCISLTKQALFDLGYLNKENFYSDSLLKSALISFQEHHGLTPNGKIGKNTREALSTSTKDRFLKIALNLDRIRKDSRSENYILINIPSYKLKVIDNSIIKDEFTVVVGNPKTPTPEFSSKVDKIIANPYWNVPVSIIQNEILPQVKKDSDYIARHNFKIVDRDLNIIELNKINWEDESNVYKYFFIQNSGNANALGLMKFIFKNPYSIYIHDTPSKRFFDYDHRAFSHGCIRIKDPYRFAEYLINNNISEEVKPDIKNLLAQKENHAIELSKPMDIYIRYYTCEADEKNNIYFYKDIYNKDDVLTASLFYR